jgi:hypothetical protein
VNLSGPHFRFGTVRPEFAVPKFALHFPELPVLPTHAGRNRKPLVSGAFRGRAGHSVFAEKPDESDAILAKHIGRLLFMPFFVGRPGVKVLGRFVGGALGGNRKNRVPQPCRAAEF